MQDSWFGQRHLPYTELPSRLSRQPDHSCRREGRLLKLFSVWRQWRTWRSSGKPDRSWMWWLGVWPVGIQVYLCHRGNPKAWLHYQVKHKQIVADINQNRARRTRWWSKKKRKKRTRAIFRYDCIVREISRRGKHQQQHRAVQNYSFLFFRLSQEMQVVFFLEANILDTVLCGYGICILITPVAYRTFFLPPPFFFFLGGGADGEEGGSFLWMTWHKATTLRLPRRRQFNISNWDSKPQPFILFYVTTALSNWDFSHGEFWLLCAGKASWDRVALPNLPSMLGVLVFP